MGQWKIGYPSGLDAVASEAAGMALYDKWSIEPITLSSKTTEVSGGQVTGVGTTYIRDTGNFAVDQFNGGFIKMRSGDQKGEVYKITDTTVDQLTVDGNPSSDGVSVGDWYEVITGSTTFTFPEVRNPVRRDFKWQIYANSKRFPYYAGGFHLPLGRLIDDFVVQAFVTDEDSMRELMALLNLKIGYDGSEATYNGEFAAPLILEEGSHVAHRQYLVHSLDAKEIRDSSRGGLREVMIHFEQIEMPSYRGI